MMPPTATETGEEAPVATFERPMYRPDEARGMMSVISAQSTAMKIPPPIPYRSAAR